VFLPLQEDPALRILAALRKHARRVPGRGQGPLRVVCGDGIGFTSLTQLAGRCPFPLWCSSSASVPAAAQAVGQGLSPDTQIPAEIVAALAACLDLPASRPLTADALRNGLAALKVPASDPSSMGRALAFSRSGERLGDRLGHVLLIQPDRPGVFALAQGASGAWSEPEVLKTDPLVLRP
jgi:hypothetical protein